MRLRELFALLYSITQPLLTVSKKELANFLGPKGLTFHIVLPYHLKEPR